jgi:hypothetical protein
VAQRLDSQGPGFRDRAAEEMSSISEWCAAHLAKPGMADPYLDRALDGILRIEALAGEPRAEPAPPGGA